jgi:transposase
MRYPQGGGLTAAQRAQREELRLEAAELFALGASQAEVADALRVTRMSASRWQRDWKKGGMAGLLSKGPGGVPCRLDGRQQARLEAALRRGPAAHGWDDQCWTGARAAELIERMFAVHYTPRGATLLLHRMGWSVQQPVHRAVERDEQAVRCWREEHWPKIVEKAAAEGAWVCFEDEAGICLHPPKGRTWAPCGQTPVVPVAGTRSGRISIAGMVCTRPGQQTRLACRMRVHTGRKDDRRSLSEADYAALITSFHEEVDAPLIVVWDNLNTHKSKEMQAFCDANASWLTVYRLPAYAPDLNPAEGVWANLRRGVHNLASAGKAHLYRAVHAGLARIGARPALLDGFVAETGLALTAS